MAATTTEYGKPMILYSDKASVFRVNNKHATTGLGDTQFARAMRCLNITPLCAETSQAKGRVERAHLTLQDRLVKELRLKGICTVGENKSIRIKVIYANDFGWIYDALSSNTPEISVNPKLVRALLARTYTFASQSLVKQELPYDFEMLKNIAEQDNVLAKLYGIAELNNGQALNASYPYTISELAKLLDMGSWHYVHKVLERIHKETGFNIKSSDNNYHVLVKTGKEGVHKYSPAAFELIKKIINGQKYKLKP